MLVNMERSIFELVRRTAVDLPADVELAIQAAVRKERKESYARSVLETLLRNVKLARHNDAPICQDTGGLIFSIQVPCGWDTNCLSAAICASISKATEAGYLRENTVDAVTGNVYPLNVAQGSPTFHFESAARDTLDVRLLIKGGGSENVGAQYSLPDSELDAGRDMEGVRKCCLDAVYRAQGNGCSPGVLGVCIGGDRASGYCHSKAQFFRRIDDQSPVAKLAELERRLLKDANQLGIGPMGLGGSTTLLGVKIGALSRVPASYFVTVSYMCWAYRRRGVLLDRKGKIKRWL